MASVRSYVYRCEHKLTGRFYIGYREANKVPARMDFGTYYFTSCFEVSNNFNNYTYKILGEFKYPKTAYEVEQSLINESRHNPLLINKQWKHTTLRISKDTRIKSLTNYKVNTDRITGKITLVEKQKPVPVKIPRKKSLLEIQMAAEKHARTQEYERLGLSYSQYKLAKNKRKDRKAAKKMSELSKI